ncbi:MAG: rRNA ((527)-N(7))-methyltransferase RsmG [Pseudomonadota bacterium]|jgi:16S rRNA (guanine527-N7)-methyltransferase
MIISDELQARAWLEHLPEWDAAAEQRLVMLVAMLAEENDRQNLVSAASLAAVWLRHIADSAQLLSYVPRETGGSWLDLGTGAGFPGLVIAALRPELRVVMVESRARRVEWLERARIALGLDNAQICGARVETLPDETFSAISARAFAPLPKLLELSARFSTTDTLWLLPKGRSARQELAELTGWRHAFHVEQSLTDPDAGVLVGTLAGRKGSKP